VTAAKLVTLSFTPSEAAPSIGLLRWGGGKENGERKKRRERCTKQMSVHTCFIGIASLR